MGAGTRNRYGPPGISNATLEALVHLLTLAFPEIVLSGRDRGCGRVGSSRKQEISLGPSSESVEVFLPEPGAQNVAGLADGGSQ